MIDLATIKRKKVSGKATQGQKWSKLLHNKLFWIISGVVLLIIIAAAIAIPLIVNNLNKSEDTKEDYVAKEYSYKDTSVSFKKMSYEGVLMHSDVDDYDDNTYYKHIFFVAFDFTTFYPDSAIDDGKSDDDEKLYNKDHKLALDALIEIQYTIDQYNKGLLEDDDASNDSDVAVMYFIDLSLSSNKGAITSTAFGGTSESTNTFAFGYIAGEDGFKSSYEYEYDSKNDPKTWNIFFKDYATLRSDSRHVTEFITGTDKHGSFQLALA